MIKGKHKMLSRLIFDSSYDELLVFEAEAKGYLGDVTVELANGSKHRVFFYDPVRLAQDLQSESEQGRPFVAEKGMIVLTKINLENMQNATAQLVADGFFASN